MDTFIPKNLLIHNLLKIGLYQLQGALMIFLQPAGMFMIGLGVYVFLVLFSTLWLKRFKSGPMEFIWRQLTYGKVVHDQPKTNTFHAAK